MAAAHVGRFRDISFALSLGRHLVNTSIRQSGTELLALCAPANTANLTLERIAYFPLLEICHVEVAAGCDDGTKLWNRRVWHQRPERLSVG